MNRNRIAVGVVIASLCWSAQRAQADCNCVAIASEVAAAVQLDAARADTLYARGDFAAALALYARGYTASKDAAFLYAEAMAQLQLGERAAAEALFRQYLHARGTLAYRARAEASLRDLGVGVAAAVSTGVGGAAEVGSRVVTRLDGDLDRGVGPGVGVVGDGVGLAASIPHEAKPPKVARGAAIVLGVVAVAAVSAVAVQGISAGFKDDVDFDTRFGLGMGLSGAVVGGTAFYLWGLTAATGAVGATCATGAISRRPMLAPVAHRGGAGLAAAIAF